MRPRLRQEGRKAEGQGARGVALLAVLWVLAGAGTAVALGLGVVSDGIATSRYRSELTRARWLAEGCLAAFRARLERAVAGSSRSVISTRSLVHDDPWVDPQPGIPPGCAIQLAQPADGPIDLSAAPESLMLALPGFDPDVTGTVVRLRTWGRPWRDLDQLLSDLPADLRDRVGAHYAELVGRVAFAPPAWVVTGQGVVVGRVVPVVSERWVLAGTRVAIVRRELR